MGSERDAYLDQVLIGGRESATITIAAYDPRWAERYARLAARAHHAVGEHALDVEHIGSTSVPGLAAKPIIDILLTVASVEDEEVYVSPLVAAGFVLRVREPGHRMLRTPARDVHLHVYAAGNPAVQDYLDLRDWLRVDEPDRELYAQTKRRLAERQWDDMNDYADAKTGVIRQILDHARDWRARS